MCLSGEFSFIRSIFLMKLPIKTFPVQTTVTVHISSRSVFTLYVIQDSVVVIHCCLLFDYCRLYLLRLSPAGAIGKAPAAHTETLPVPDVPEESDEEEDINAMRERLQALRS